MNVPGSVAKITKFNQDLVIGAALLSFCGQFKGRNPVTVDFVPF